MNKTLGIFLITLSVSSVFAEGVVPPHQTDKNLNCININRADITTLQKAIKGIGKKRSKAIITYREQHPFQSIEEIAKVPGIGKLFVEKRSQELKNKFCL